MKLKIALEATPHSHCGFASKPSDYFRLLVRGASAFGGKADNHLHHMNRMEKKRLATILCSICLALSAATIRAQFVTTNLLVNPGAETGDLTGWTIGGASHPFAGDPTNSLGDDFPTHSGNYYFVGGTGAAYGSLSQLVALSSNQGVTTQAIDSGGLLAGVSFWEQGFNQGTPSDDGNIALTFYDVSSNTISSVSTPIIDSHNLTWSNYASLYGIPSGTRFIRYTMNFYRNVGVDVDAFFDDNVLIVIDSRSLPRLGIKLTGTNAVITWPAAATNFTLYSSTNLSSPVWNIVSNMPVVIGTNCVVTNNISRPQFFRLQSPL